MTRLDADALAAARAALEGMRGFWYTRRCLMFELVRRGAWPDPGDELDACEAAFAGALARHEHEQGPLARLVRPELAIAGLRDDELARWDLPPDLFDYSIQRVALFERLDLCLMLIANGFHREIEIALTVPPEFPTHVWPRIEQQIAANLPTTFLAICDCGEAHEAWLDGLDARFGSGQVRRVGLTVPWASKLGLPLRDTRSPRENPLDTNGADVLRSGSHALLEELPPLMVMRWIYRRVARGAEDIGFG
jgi:hypothetical protein